MFASLFMVSEIRCRAGEVSKATGQYMCSSKDREDSYSSGGGIRRRVVSTGSKGGKPGSRQRQPSNRTEEKRRVKKKSKENELALEGVLSESGGGREES